MFLFVEGINFVKVDLAEKHRETNKGCNRDRDGNR